VVCRHQVADEQYHVAARQFTASNHPMRLSLFTRGAVRCCSPSSEDIEGVAIRPSHRRLRTRLPYGKCDKPPPQLVRAFGNCATAPRSIH
jgi:hypothetical protein